MRLSYIVGKMVPSTKKTIDKSSIPLKLSLSNALMRGFPLFVKVPFTGDMFVTVGGTVSAISRYEAAKVMSFAFFLRISVTRYFWNEYPEVGMSEIRF